MAQPLWTTVWKFLKTLKAELPYDPAFLLHSENPSQKDTCTPVFAAALLAAAKTQKPPKWPSTEKWTKMRHVFIYREYYSAVGRNEIGSFVEIWMATESIIRTQVREKQILYSNAYRWNLEK